MLHVPDAMHFCTLRCFPGDQAAFSMLEMKCKHGQTDACLDDMCRLITSCKLPRRNIHPTSLHMCKGVAECRDFRDTIRHVCKPGCTLFPTLAPSEYGAHVGDICTECGTNRIIEVKLGLKLVLQPARLVYDLGVANAIQQLFNDHDFTKLRTSGRDVEGDYYKSTEAARLHTAAGADINDHDTSVYELGMDFFQLYQKSQYSIGLVMIR